MYNSRKSKSTFLRVHNRLTLSGINPRPIKHPKSLFLDPLSCILDGESTPNRETGPNKEGRALLGRISLVKWKVTICSCPTREQQTLSRPLLRYPRAYIFLSVALRDPFLLSPPSPHSYVPRTRNTYTKPSVRAIASAQKTTLASLCATSRIL